VAWPDIGAKPSSLECHGKNWSAQRRQRGEVRGIERVRGAETDCGGGGAGRAGEVEIAAGDVAESRVRPALVANGNFGDNGLSACGQACLIRDAAHDRAGRSRSCSCEAERYHQHPGRRHVSGPSSEQDRSDEHPLQRIGQRAINVRVTYFSRGNECPVPGCRAETGEEQTCGR